MDPLDGVADLCAEFGLWMHVDAAWGGGVVMSARHRHLVRGIERSVTVLLPTLTMESKKIRNLGITVGLNRAKKR